MTAPTPPPIITLDAARELIAELLAPAWPAELGTLYVAPYGYEDERGILVTYGAREALLDDDPAFDLMDPDILIVDKRTGAVERTTLLADLDRIDAMTPVGEGHPEDDEPA